MRLIWGHWLARCHNWKYWCSTKMRWSHRITVQLLYIRNERRKLQFLIDSSSVTCRRQCDWSESYFPICSIWASMAIRSARMAWNCSRSPHTCATTTSTIGGCVCYNIDLSILSCRSVSATTLHSRWVNWNFWIMDWFNAPTNTKVSP